MFRAGKGEPGREGVMGREEVLGGEGKGKKEGRKDGGGERKTDLRGKGRILREIKKRTKNVKRRKGEGEKEKKRGGDILRGVFLLNSRISSFKYH